jgi:hypothetical protein
MNTGQIIRDDNNNVYLKVEGEPLESSVYFEILTYTSDIKGKITELSTKFNINLTGKEE